MVHAHAKTIMNMVGRNVIKRLKAVLLRTLKMDLFLLLTPPLVTLVKTLILLVLLVMRVPTTIFILILMILSKMKGRKQS